MRKGYKKDLRKKNERTTPLMCRACRERPALVSLPTGALCYECKCASEPVALDGEIIAGAISTITKEAAAEILDRILKERVV